MSITNSKKKINSEKLNLLKEQLNGFMEEIEGSKNAMIESVTWFNKTFNRTLIDELWFVDLSGTPDTKVFIETIEDVIPSLKEAHEKMRVILHEDEDIDLGVFNERVSRMNSIIKYVHNKAVPSEEYEQFNWNDKIRSFAILPDNWDGEDAQKIPRTRINAALKFLKAFEDYKPHLTMVYPSWIGSVGLMYEIDGYKITIVFRPKDKLEINVISPDSEIKYSEQIDDSEFKSFEPYLN